MTVKLLHGQRTFTRVLVDRSGKETVVRVVIDDLMPGAKKDLWWHPHSAKVYKGMLSILRLVAGPGLGTRLAAALNVVRFFFRYWNRD